MIDVGLLPHSRIQFHISFVRSTNRQSSNEPMAVNGLPDCCTSRPFDIDKSQRFPHKLSYKKKQAYSFNKLFGIESCPNRETLHFEKTNVSQFKDTSF